MIPQQTSVFRSIPIVAFYETGAKHLITHPKQGASHANYARLFRSKPLIFVRRGVSYCNAVARATAALLGRFLPRLGPLATRERPLFLPFAFSNSTQPPRRDRDAAHRVEFRRAGAPQLPYLRQAAGSRRYVGSAVRPCKARD